MKKAFFFVIIILFSASIVIAQDNNASEKKDDVKKEAKEAPARKKTRDQYLADLSSDKDEKLIVTAAEWAANEKEKDAIPKLVKLLDDQRDNVRMYSVMALGYIKDEKYLGPIHKVLLDDSSPEVRYAAMLATIRIGSKESIDTWKKVKDKESDPFILDILKKMEEKAKGN